MPRPSTVAISRRTPSIARLASTVACAVAVGCAGRGTPPLPPAPLASTVTSLRAAIHSMVSAPEFRNAHWGVLIVDPATGDTLYSLNAGKLFLPASNMKIVTGAVALALLGPDFRFRTTFAAQGTLADSALHGDLVVHGRGDPSVSDHMRGDAMLALWQVADSLVARGVRHITGHILAGDDVFPDAAYGYGWAWDDFQQPYAAGIDELFFNEGFARVTLRGGASAGAPVSASVTPAPAYPPLRVQAITVAPDSIFPAAGSAPGLFVSHAEAIPDASTGGMVVTGQLAPFDTVTLRVVYPDQRTAYLTALRDALLARGITVGDTTTPPPRVVDEVPEHGVFTTLDTLFVYESPPLREVLAALEKPSQNQIAEILLKTIGLERTGVGTADSGRRVVEAQLLAWGVEPDGFLVRDGSGLSRNNYLSPETIVRTLDAIRRDSLFAAFYDALPIAGIDGTIANRMRGTAAEGNARAKTGYIANARALSGYVTAPNGRMLIFSLLCNNWTTPVWSVEIVQDAITAQLATLVPDEDAS